MDVGRKMVHNEIGFAMHNDDYDDRTTGEVLTTLDSDYLKCYQHVIRQLNVAEKNEDGDIIAVDTDFESRQMVRAAFAYVEGATFVLKTAAVFDAEERGIELTPQQQHFIFDVDFDLSENGDVIQKSSKISLAKNIRFAFAVYAESNEVENTLDPGAKWWSLLKESIRVRDRLTHPRYPSDLDVSPDEIIAMIEAKSGFDAALHEIVAAARKA